MEIATQYLNSQAKKKSSDTVQIILTGTDSMEKTLLGAAFMIGLPEITMEDEGSLTLNFRRLCDCE